MSKKKISDIFKELRGDLVTIKQEFHFLKSNREQKKQELYEIKK